MESLTSRRILVLGQPGSGILKFLQDLTGSQPFLPAPPDAARQQSLAGLSHTWHLKTAYYDVTIPIWIDEIGRVDAPGEDDDEDDDGEDDDDEDDDDEDDEDDHPRTFNDAVVAWQREFLKEEAKEVLDVLGAVVVCFGRPQTEDDIDRIKTCLGAVSAVRDRGCGPDWDGVVLAVGNVASSSDTTRTSGTSSESSSLSVRTFDEWDEMMMDEFGCEYIDFEMTGRNAYGETTGVARVKDALSVVDWRGDARRGGLSSLLSAIGTDADSDVAQAGDTGSREKNIEEEVRELERELFGLSRPMINQASSAKDSATTKDALYDEDSQEMHDDEPQAAQLQSLEVMMSKLQAIREKRKDESSGDQVRGTPDGATGDPPERNARGRNPEDENHVGPEDGERSIGGLSDLERKRDALKTVRELMREF